MYVLFASLLKFFNLAFIEIIWLFFCLFHIFRLFGYFFGFFYFLYVLFGFSLKFSNLASIEIIWLFFYLFVLYFCITWIILLVHLIWIQRSWNRVLLRKESLDSIFSFQSSVRWVSVTRVLPAPETPGSRVDRPAAPAASCWVRRFVRCARQDGIRQQQTRCSGDRRNCAVEDEKSDSECGSMCG